MLYSRGDPVQTSGKIAWQQAGKAGVRSTSGNVRAQLLLDLIVARGQQPEAERARHRPSDTSQQHPRAPCRMQSEEGSNQVLGANRLEPAGSRRRNG